MAFIRMTLFFALLFYLVGLGFLLPAINNEIGNNQVDYKGGNYTVTNSNQDFNIITSITSLPLWFNILFIIIPFIIMVITLFTMFTPTIDAG